MNLLKLILGKKKKKVSKKTTSAADTIDQLNKTLEMLEKREKQLQQKVSAEAEKAKDYAKLKNKNATIQCLKKKKLYEAQTQQLVNSQLRLHDQIITLESAKATQDTIEALKSGSSAVQALQQSLTLDEIEKVVSEDTRENFESIKEIQDLLANPVGISAEFNEDDFEAELEKLELQVREGDQLPAASLHLNASSSNVYCSESPAAPVHPKPASQSISVMDSLPELHSTQPANETDSLSIDNVKELPATQPTQRRVSRSISNVVEHSSHSLANPVPRKTVSRSITNVGQYSSHLPATVGAQKTVSQCNTALDEFPQVPATPVRRNIGNMQRPAPVSRRTIRSTVA
ncbi:hypothetical protein LUZ63_013057 [Rhynchospora breviuscula]|uniref:Uncharacterized protein n=1 Tax=Rhynchospora breviuscula TaxID=2022672 RepID=A0A9Q0HJV1_9POAL|nr:hypothetical protein LUZ63_013057 [Rhynchospora breviuscula]